MATGEERGLWNYDVGWKIRICNFQVCAKTWQNTFWSKLISEACNICKCVQLITGTPYPKAGTIFKNGFVTVYEAGDNRKSFIVARVPLDFTGLKMERCWQCFSNYIVGEVWIYQSQVLQSVYVGVRKMEWIKMYKVLKWEGFGGIYWVYCGLGAGDT